MAQNALSTQTVLAPLRERPERMAWLVILGSFAIFATFAVTLPLGWRYTVEHATVHQPARVEPLAGTLFIREPRANERVALDANPNDDADIRVDVPDGSHLSTGKSSGQANIELLETDDPLSNAFGTLKLSANTQVELVHLRRPLFERSTQPYEAVLELDQGRIDVFSSPASNQRPLYTEVETPHGQILLPPGQYRIVVAGESSEITVLEGRAELIHPEQGKLLVENDFRAWMEPSGIVSELNSVGQDLVKNGDFGEDLRDWEPETKVEVPTTTGQARQSEEGGRNLVQFFRKGKTEEERRQFNLVELRQPINQSVVGFDQLELQLDARIVYQNLAGGGWQGTEFPLRVEIGFRDLDDRPQVWGVGFYAADMHPLRDDNPNNDGWAGELDENSQAIPRGQWEPYVSVNLLELWKDQGRPASGIDFIRVYANGHDYTSYVDDVRLVAE